MSESSPALPERPLHVERVPLSLAREACQKWHYTQTLPTAGAYAFGVWENGTFIGAVVFGAGTARLMPAKYGLLPSECLELTRVALDEHVAPVSQIVAQCLKALREACPALRLVYSYADPEQGHRGGIYQALNFIYTGSSNAQRELVIEGKHVHKRTASSRWGTASVPRLRELTGLCVKYGPKKWKHVYLLPVGKSIRRAVEAARKPYPKPALCAA